MTGALPIPAWMDEAVCASVYAELFFGDEGLNTAAAKRICRSRPVMEVCGRYAIDNGLREGVWGGMSERQRRRRLEAV